MSFKKTLSTHFHNIRGWRTNRRIVVIESDDWGSLRMTSKATYDKLAAQGYRLDRCPYNTYDSLESSEDLQQLFSVLSSVKDRQGNYACITPNYNVSNPDFDKIKEGGFRQYHYKPFTDALEEYYPGNDILNMVKQGYKDRLFVPQYHGREHINTILWIEALQEGNQALHAGFEEQIFGLSQTTSPLIRKPYLATLIYRNNTERTAIETSLTDGASLFKSIFGYTATSFIAPLYTWNPELEHTLKKVGIRYMQGANFHRQYDAVKNNRSIQRHAMGSRSASGLIYTARNCFLEPSLHPGADVVNNCMQQIRSAFFWKKPAVICSHRLNYIGSIVPDNRSKNLQFLKQTLDSIVKEWPDVEFMSSDALGDVILQNQS